MEKKSLKTRLSSQHDYSCFDIEKPTFKKYPIKDYTDATFTSAYHMDKINTSIKIFKKLNGLSVTQYFKYHPHLVERLRMSSLAEVDSERDATDMTMDNIMSYIGMKVDKEQDFEIAASLCSTLMEPIKDGYIHPLYSSLFIHNQEMVKMLTDGKHGDYDTERKRDLYQSMNDFLRERDLRRNRRDLSRLFGEEDKSWSCFFNNIVIPSIAVKNCC